MYKTGLKIAMLLVSVIRAKIVKTNICFLMHLFWSKTNLSSNFLSDNS